MSSTASRLLATALVLAAFGFMTAATVAATLTVDDNGPADFSSIQAAINAALDGDEVLVFPGRYRETLNFLGKAITVRSQAGPRETVVFLEGETRIVLLNGNSTLRGFTITGGAARIGGGIRVTDSARAVIEDNIIENNVAPWNDATGFPGFGGGIAVDLMSEPVITRNIIRGNLAEGDALGMFGYGGAIDLAAYTSATITNNVIVNNQATDTGGGISMDLAGTSTPVVITNNTIAGNRAGRDVPNDFSFGGGISVADGAEVIIRNNAITGNSSAFRSGGIHFFGTGTQGITYEFNDFDGNQPTHCEGLPGTKCSSGQFFFPPLYQEEASGNYRLRSDSELIDRAAATGAPALDRDGRPRPADGDLNGAAAPDIGAFENQKEITRLRFDSASALLWDGSRNPQVTFDVYRDLISALAPGPIGVCWRSGLTGTTTTDPEPPPAGDGFFYLVVGRDVVVGSLGFASDGSERTPASACP